jgi:hypothetical protein
MDLPSLDSIFEEENRANEQYFPKLFPEPLYHFKSAVPDISQYQERLPEQDYSIRNDDDENDEVYKHN